MKQRSVTDLASPFLTPLDGVDGNWSSGTHLVFAFTTKLELEHSAFHGYADVYNHWLKVAELSGFETTFFLAFVLYEYFSGWVVDPGGDGWWVGLPARRCRARWRVRRTLLSVDGLDEVFDEVHRSRRRSNDDVAGEKYR
jgi:hypothetical protein